MIGAIIGAAASIGSSLYSGIKSAQAAKKAKRQVEQQKAENAAWYNRRYNEDGTQRADAQRILRKTQEAIKNRNQQAAATQAVVGGTEESVAATKEANANALAETASAINAQADARKDTIEQSYRQTETNLNNQLNNIETQRSQNIAAAGSQAVSAMGQLGSSINGSDSDTKAKSADGAKAVNGGAEFAAAHSSQYSPTTAIAVKAANDANDKYNKMLGVDNDYIVNTKL